MEGLMVVWLVLQGSALAQDPPEEEPIEAEVEAEADDEELPPGTPSNAKEFEGFAIEMKPALQGGTARPGDAPPIVRKGSKAVTEDGTEIAFIELQPGAAAQTSTMPAAWLVAVGVGGSMLLLGVVASLFMLRAASEPETETDATSG